MVTILTVVFIVFCINYHIKDKTIYVVQKKGVISSIIICVTILVVYYNLNFDKILEKLTSDSILIAIGSSIPVIYLYKYNFIEKEKSKLIEEYNIWTKKFEEANTNSEIYFLAVYLESILSRKNNIKTYDDFLNLEETFILVQEKLKDVKNEQRKQCEQCLKRWKETISIILIELSKCGELKRIPEYWSVPESTINIVSVDFNQVAKLNLKYKDAKGKVNFRYCNFKKDFLEKWEFLNSDAEYFFDTCSFDVVFKKDSFNFEFDIKLEFKNCYIESEPSFYKINIDEIQDNERDSIYEERELGKNNTINKWLLTGKEILIDISNNKDKIKIENKIIQGLKNSPQIKEIPEIRNISENNYVFSKSKNYCPDTKDGYLYEWRSWNVLSKEKSESENAKLYIFVVQLNANENKKFVCLLFDKEKFGEMISNLTLTKDKRYYFYFAKMKDE
ncbi:hypothetical protein [uncultured Granulicatella sp.]|uniref:hypothetical protein n=1 Tax=uncultured Granulicatella sp. TaxID=316089 RepID=UPI0028D4351E|nr:hypothetical protein [uncultured Granulicatella sp.]